MEQIVDLDKALFLYLNNLGTSQWDGFWLFVTEKEVWIPLYGLFAYLLFRKFGIKKTLLIFVLTALLILCVDQVSNIFKYGIQRLRPCFTDEFEGLMRPVACEGRGKFSFVSAHASNHFAIAVFLGMLYRKYFKWMIWVLLIWASMIAYSRIYLGVHFPLDIVCGGVIGILFALLLYWIFKKILQIFPGYFEEG
ncbi:MAG: phosphatase PAP2 family protein [Weeksellaceae bacterium]